MVVGDDFLVDVGDGRKREIFVIYNKFAGLANDYGKGKRYEKMCGGSFPSGWEEMYEAMDTCKQYNYQLDAIGRFEKARKNDDFEDFSLGVVDYF